MENLIKNPYRASQVLDFAGILKPPLSMIDIDGCLDWHNKGYVLVEVKYRDKDMPLGQKIAIERMVNDFHDCGKRACAILVEHYVSDTQQSVMVGECNVREVYFDVEKMWRKPKETVTAQRFIQEYIKWLDNNGGK